MSDLRVSIPEVLTAEDLANLGPYGPKQRSKVSRPDPIEVPANQPQNAGMSDVTRHEMTANLAATEAKVAAAIADMRTENAKFLGELSSFKNDLATSFTNIGSRLDTQAATLESKLSGLKIWVLSGALAGVLALLTVVVTGIIRYAPAIFSPQQSSSQPQSAPAPPAPVLPAESTSTQPTSPPKAESK